MVKSVVLSMCFFLAMLNGVQAASIELRDAWSRPAASMAVGYLTVVNQGSRTDAIDRVKSPIASSITLHLSKRLQNDAKMSGMEGMSGMTTMPTMTMVPLQDIVIPAKTTVHLAPGSYHLMLTGLHHPLRENEIFPLDIHFVHQGWLHTLVHVRK